MKRIFALVPVLAMSLAASGVLLAQDNSFFGTWKLNVAKSKFVGTQAPQSETRILEPQGNGEKVTYDGITADGSRISYTFNSNFDGKDSPISGSNQPFGADTIAVTRVDANTITAISKKGGKTLVTTRSVLSKDGKTTTNTSKGINAQGQLVNQVLVWERQ